MSPIGAVIFGVLLITGMMLAAGNYTKLGFSTRTWILVNAAIFAVFVLYEIIHKIRNVKDSSAEKAGEEHNDTK